MGRLGEHINKPVQREAADQQMFSAKVVNNASSRDDDVFVTVQDFDDGRHKFGPVVWDPVVTPDGIFFPKKDAEALVSKPDSTLQMWMPLWEELGEPDEAVGVGESIGVTVHADDPEKARPSDASHRVWIGTVKPLNAIEYDQWIKPE